MEKETRDLTGQQFGRWTVLRRGEDRINKRNKKIKTWVCQCSCENHTIKEVIEANLIRGLSSSCGCLKREQLIEFNQKTKRKHNTYVENEDCMVGYTTNTNKEFYISKEDYEFLKNFSFCEHVKSNGYTILEAYDSRDKKEKNILEILDCKGYDHIDRNTFNNQRNNLRPATQSQNVLNRSVSSANNSGVIGVGWRADTKKWRARITYKNQRYFLGDYKDFEDAIKARLEAEKKYFGEWAPQRHLWEQYGIKDDWNIEEQQNNAQNEERNVNNGEVN